LRALWFCLFVILLSTWLLQLLPCRYHACKTLLCCQADLLQSLCCTSMSA